jgi:hypothetical protein
MPLAQSSINDISRKFKNTNKLVQAVKTFLGRNPKDAAAVSTNNFPQPLQDRLPQMIRILQTPDPSQMIETVSMLFYYKENDGTSVVYVYYVDEA